jgi:hypothetical protein
VRALLDEPALAGAGGDGEERAIAAISVLVPHVERLAAELRARAAPGAPAPALAERDDRLALEGLAAYRGKADELRLAWPPPAGASLEDYPRCWFGVSAEDGLPWMYCLKESFARELVRVAEHLATALAGQG